ncbi:hypothetical protein H072_107 [Dactylellina haptotyla CBS 200.50]|uniref:FAD-binding domain-containing protein n=1 Tax=Dactylellina haptotyla (strain CBS 200.50) TaxID=1284197 RepID=S8CE23_DACHA|nr:hypothetical protein H072_107 [Dactylellina haptotyla CBS 200.50]
MTPPESDVDVLIIGAGPAGLMLATWLSRLNIRTRIVDKRSTKIMAGQADGFQCRTLEILDSFGIDRVWKESNHMLEVCFWNPDENGVIKRTGRVPDTPQGFSRFTECVLHQGRMERFFLDHLKDDGDTVRVERAILPSSLQINEEKVEDAAAYPITIRLQHLTDEEATPDQGKNIPNGLFRSNLTPDDTEDLIRKASGKEGTEEVVRAKYLVGCDGAHSWTRKQLGFQMEGEHTEIIWGVLDIIPITDFPDIRVRSLIHSASSGSLMVIPREKRVVRLYIQLKEVSEGGGAIDRSKVTPEQILKAAQKIIAPYKLEYEHCGWFTAYQIAQRVSDGFDKFERVFLAGDAVHTHSPKAGQGQNVSLQDSYNLGWKIGLVARGQATREILKTYPTERQQIARDLIAFDQKFSKLFSGRPAKDVSDETGISLEEFRKVFHQGAVFAAGLSVDYGPNILVVKEDEGKIGGVRCKPSLAEKLKIGMRLPSHKVVNQSDSLPVELQKLLPSDGRFRLIVFPGNISKPKLYTRYEKLGEYFSSSTGLVSAYTPEDTPRDSVIEILTVHSAKRLDVELQSLPEAFHPLDKARGWDYWKIYADDESYHEGHGRVYENFGIDRDEGCIVIVRPDGYVATVVAVDNTNSLEAYFARFMIKV